MTIGAIPNSEWQTLTPLLETLGWNKNQEQDPETWYPWYQSEQAAEEVKAGSLSQAPI